MNLTNNTHLQRFIKSNKRLSEIYNKFAIYIKIMYNMNVKFFYPVLQVDI